MKIIRSLLLLSTRHLINVLTVSVVILASILLSPISANDQFSLASINLNRLFDDNRDGKESKVLSQSTFKRRIALTADYFSNHLKLPDIIAIQEIENLNSMGHISDRIKNKTGTIYRNILLPGNDSSGINVGIMVKTTFRIDDYYPLFKKERLSIDGTYLFSRPPLFAKLCQLSRCLSLINVHLRSMRGISKSRRNRLKRLYQAQMLAREIDHMQNEFPVSLAIIGDFNGLKPSDRWVDVIGTIEGKPDNQRPVVKSEDLVEPDLIDATLAIPVENRTSYNYKGRHQQLDYLFLNSQFDAVVNDIRFLPIDRKLSDHAALLVNLSWK